MNSTKRRFIAVICFTTLTLAGCGMNAETEKEYINKPSYNMGAAVTEPTSEPEQTTESKKTTTATTSKDCPDNREAYSEDETPTSQQPAISNEPQNDTEGLAETTNANPEVAYNNSVAPTHLDTSMCDECDNEITYKPKTEPIAKASNGNVSLIGTLQEQMGKQPLCVSKEESEMFINMLNEIDLEPVDSTDPASIPIGGGYIMEIEGEERYILLGGRYLQIGDKYYYDANNKSDALSGKIGAVLYSYYGEP